MTSCKLLVYYPGDFRIFSGTIQSESPFKIVLQNDIADELVSSIHMKLKWFEGVSSKYASVVLTDEGDGLYSVDFSSDVTTEKNDSHFIEYREHFEVVRVDETKTGDFRHRVDKVNHRYRSTLATQIKKIITDETLTNQYLFKLLLQIDSKMDELLDSLKQEDPVEGLTDTRMMSFGGGGLSFLNDRADMNKGDIAYIQSMPKGGTGVNFAALCKITDVIKSGDMQICEAGYEYIDETTRETIIHYIFQKEREQLKRIRN